MSAIIVCGPQGCGKTTIAVALARQLGCTRIVDDWDGKMRLAKNALALTSIEISSLSPRNRVRALSFHEALSRLQHASPA